MIEEIIDEFKEYSDDNQTYAQYSFSRAKLIQEVTKQIQSELLKEVMDIMKETEDYKYVQSAKIRKLQKLAEEKGILIN